MEKLAALLAELENRISQHNALNEAVSKRPVGWHIEHLLLAFNQMVNALKKSNPEDYKWEFKIMRFLVLSTGWIPRGKAQSPSVVLPIKYDEITLRNDLEVAKNKLKELEIISTGHCYNHPFFGYLTFDETVRMLGIHTKHHLKIINDILKKSMD